MLDQPGEMRWLDVEVDIHIVRHGNPRKTRWRRNDNKTETRPIDGLQERLIITKGPASAHDVVLTLGAPRGDPRRVAAKENETHLLAPQPQVLLVVLHLTVRAADQAIDVLEGETQESIFQFVVERGPFFSGQEFQDRMPRLVERKESSGKPE